MAGNEQDGGGAVYLRAKLDVSDIASNAEVGKTVVKDFANSVANDVNTANKSLSNLGGGGNQNIDRMAAAFSGVTDAVKEMVKESDRSLKSFVSQIQNSAASTESVTSAMADTYERKAKLKGLDPAVTGPYVAALRQLATENDALKAASDRQAEATRKSSAAAAEAAAKFSNFERSVQTAKIELLSFGKTAAEKFQIRAEVMGLDKNSATQAILADLKAAEAQMQATASTISSKATPAMGGLVEGSRAFNAAMRQVPAQITDIVVGLQGGQAPLTVLLQQGGQLRDVFGSVGGAASALGRVLMSMLTPWTAVAAAVGAVAYGYSQGSKEADEFRKTLVLTGGAAGVTTGQLSAMAGALDGMGTTQSKAAESLNLFAQAGITGASSLERYTLAAIRLEEVGGNSVKETAAAFADLGKEPLKASIKLNESTNFLTQSVYDQIKALDDQGKSVEAARVAQEAYATTVERSASDIAGNLGYVESAWVAIKKATKEAIDAVKDIGRNDPLEVQAKKLQETIKQYKDLGYDTTKEDAQLSALSKRILLQQDSAQLDAQRAEQLKASIKWSQDETKYLGDKLKMEREIAKIRNEGFAAGASQSDIDSRISKVRSDYAKRNKPAKEDNTFSSLMADIGKFDESARQYLETNTKLEESDKFRIETLSKIAEQWAIGKITLDQAVEAELAMYDAQQKRVDVELTLRELEQQKADIIETAKNFDDVQKTTDALIKQVATQRDHVAALGLTKDAVAELEAAKLREQATSKDRLATVADEIDFSGELGNQYRAQAQALRDLAALKTEGAYKQIAIDDAKKAAEEWKKTADKIESSITDALMRGFESGKDFAANLRGTVVNMFKTLVLRPIVSAIVNPVAGAITGSLGLSGAANAANTIGGVGNAASAFSIGGLGNPFSNIGGFLSNGVADFGTALVDRGFTQIGSSFEGFGLAMKSNEAALNALGDGLGYLGAVMSAADGKWGAAIGAGIGTYFGGPLGSAIGGAIGGWLDSAFGPGREYTTGQGISGKFSGGGFTGQNYQTWRNDGSSGIFGFGGTAASSGTRYSAMDAATQSGLSRGFMALQVAAAGMTVSLGLDAKKIAEYSQDISVALGEDAAKNKKAIEDAFNGVADNLALAVAPQIAEFSKSGETASSTLSRLSSSIITSNAWLSILRQRLFQVSLAGADAASKLADAFGGLDKLTASSQAFFDLYYSNGEKVAANQKAMTDTLANLGLALPTTKDQFKALALSLDLNTDSGRAAYATLLELAPQFAATADLSAQAAKETAAALIKAFTANGQLVPTLKAAELSLAGVQSGANIVVGAMTQIHTVMGDTTSPVLTFSGSVTTLSTELTGAQKSSLSLQDQIEALSGASAKAVIDFDGLTRALEGASTATFVEVVGQVFDALATRITNVIDSIGTERVAVREAALQIINPTALSKQSIQAGIAGINTALPSNAALISANAALNAANTAQTQAQDKITAANSTLVSAKNTMGADVAFYRGLSSQFSNIVASVGGTAWASNGGQAYGFDANTNRFNDWSNASWPSVSAKYAALNQLRGQGYATAGTSPTSIIGQLSGEGGAISANAKLAADEAAIAAAANALAVASAAAQAATSSQAEASAAAAKALLDYQKALQGFAIDASKSVSKLSNLRAETVKYYEAQKALADLMQTSATNLLSTVANYRFQQLSPEAQSANLQAQFGSAYSMALASQADGNTLATYADKLNSTLGPLIDSLKATGQDSLINSFLAQAEAVAKLLQDNAPQNYAADSLDMLSSIDATLAALDASSKSAEQVISDAVTAGSDRTAAGLYAVIAAITGKTVPAFASGGAYGGGLALVGEDGPELINFNQPGQVYNAAQTQGMFSNGSVVAELQAMRAQLEAMGAETRSTAISSSKTAKILERVTPDGVSLQTVAA